ncbi:MAG TPA: hypothetical protein VNM38_08125 [Solirubrobacterales bacterium]|nr:hypothetical protein [Solirubrobacterales bacterium]
MRPAERLLALLALGIILATGLPSGSAERASAEQTQRGNLISALKGELRPLALPRGRLAPVAVHLDGRLRSADGSTVPRVTRLELGLPSRGKLSTEGLPVCRLRRLHDTRTAEALAACRPALVGRGSIEALVALPNQAPFRIRARLLAFNARIGTRRAVLLHAAAANPPTSVVLPLLLESGKGRLGTALVGDVSSSLGPWPHLRRFRMTLFRRYRTARGQRSYLSASCPIPHVVSAGFFTFARVSYELVGGRRIGTAITRGCRAR